MGKPPRRGTRHPGLLSLSLPRLNKYRAWGGGVNRHIVWYTNPYTWSHSVAERPDVWLACGDQRRLTGSGGSSWRCAIQIHVLYFFTVINTVVWCSVVWCAAFTAVDSYSCGELAGTGLPRQGNTEICQARQPPCSRVGLRHRLCRLCVHILRIRMICYIPK